MGRQLPIIATPQDCGALCHFIHDITPIKLFRGFAASVEELWISDWPDLAAINETSICIWPQCFEWQPQYKQTGGPRCPPSRRGQYYVSNSSNAPILEMTSQLGQSAGGRIYWAKEFSAPNGLPYDVDAFSSLVDKIWRWIRTRGRNDGKETGFYYLPNAWAKMNREA